MNARDRIRDLLSGPEPVTWVTTGDSITHGLRHTHGSRSYVEHLHERVRGELERFGDVFVNTGVSGHRTHDILSDLEARVLRFGPQIVVLMLGTNDATDAAQGRARFRRELAEICDRILASGAVLVLQTPPPILPGSELDRTDLPAYADAVRAVAGDRDVILVDHDRHWRAVGSGAPPTTWLDDPIHPNAAGHQVMAGTLTQAIGIAEVNVEVTDPIGRAGFVLAGASVVLPDRVVERGWVRVVGERIVETGVGPAPPGPVVDLAGRTLAPGFVDMHVHGGGGGSFQDGEPEDVRRAAEFHRDRGTTTLLASLVTGPLDDMTRSVAALRDLVGDGVLAGIHLEGPFLAPSRCGAHDPRHLREPSPGTLNRLLAAGEDALAMVTLAPELDGGVSAVRQVVDAGALAAIGHTEATYDTTRRAVAAGATVATHLFNAMPPMHHRDPGPVPALLEDDRVTVELIHDGHHLHDSLLRTVLRAAGGRVALVSDAIPAAGLPPGKYRLGGQQVTADDDTVVLTGTGSLAGSVITVADAVRRAVSSGIDLHSAITAATATPARALGIHDRVGSLRTGLMADVNVLDQAGALVGVMTHGTWRRAPNASQRT